MLEHGWHEDLFKLLLDGSGPWDEVLPVAREELFAIAARYRVDWLGAAWKCLQDFKRAHAKLAAAERWHPKRSPDAEARLDWERELLWVGE